MKRLFELYLFSSPAFYRECKIVIVDTPSGVSAMTGHKGFFSVFNFAVRIVLAVRRIGLKIKAAFSDVYSEAKIAQGKRYCKK